MSQCVRCGAVYGGTSATSPYVCPPCRANEFRPAAPAPEGMTDEKVFAELRKIGPFYETLTDAAIYRAGYAAGAADLARVTVERDEWKESASELQRQYLTLESECERLRKELALQDQANDILTRRLADAAIQREKGEQ